MKSEWYGSIDLIDKSIKVKEEIVEEWFANTSTHPSRKPKWIKKEEEHIRKFKLIREKVKYGNFDTGCRDNDTDIQEENS